MSHTADISADEALQQLSRIQLLVDSILPALAGVDPELPPPARLAQAVESNVRWTVQMIIESPEGQARAAEGRVKCVGAIYTRLQPAGCAFWRRRDRQRMRLT